MKTKFIIQDWASNTLQYNGKFNRGCYGQDIGVPKKFKSFEDGWDWIYSNIKDEDCYQDLFVLILKSVPIQGLSRNENKRTD